MKKIFFLLFLFFSTSLLANEVQKCFEFLKENDKILRLKHFSAPGCRETHTFDVRVRSSQRNLGSYEIKQGKKYSRLYKKHNNQIKTALSSQWFRAMETCQFFGEFKTFSALNSTFSSRFAGNSRKQKKQLQEYIKNWNGDGNLLLCSHYVIVSEHLSYGASEGEMVLTDKNLNILAKYSLKN